MPIRLESSLERACVQLAANRGGVLLKLEHRRGWPDRLLFMPGSRLAFVELKRQGKKPRKLQVYFGNTIISLGFKYRVIDTTKKFRQLLNEMDPI